MIKRRNAITNEQKAALRTRHRQTSETHMQLQKWYEETYKHRIPLSSISQILSSAYDFLDTLEPHQLGQKRRRAEHWPELEAALFMWINRAMSNPVKIPQEVIREQARQFWPQLYPDKPLPQFSNGWLDNFRARRGIKRPRSKQKQSDRPRSNHGEAQSLSEDAAAEMIETRGIQRPRLNHGEPQSVSTDAAAEMVQIRKILRVFAPQDIFNCDETGLCWKMPPDQRLPTVSCRKKEKTRICALFCCNSDASERLPIWFIGCAKRPRAFTAAGINPENLGCKWRSNTKARMSEDIFKEWLFWFDQRMGGRKVALLLDNLSIHKAAYAEIGEQLQNTLVIWLPASSTSRFQPLDQGIVRVWKAYWKRQWILYMMAEFDRGFNPISTMTILQALRWAIPAWNIDLKDDIIRQCFKKALTIEDITEIDEKDLMNEIQQGIQKLELSNHIQEAMSIRQFLNPADEQVNDDVVDLDDNTTSQFDPANGASDDDDDAWEALPQISPAEALECLYKLRLFEEQQVDGDQRLIQHLMRHERVLLRKKIEKEQQSHVRMFYE